MFFGRQNVMVPFFIDEDCYNQGTKQRNKNILLYFRDDQPRRLPEFTLKLAERLHQKTEFNPVLYGGGKNNDFENLGSISDKKELGRLYQESAAGLCFSITNPSLVGYEMLMSGLPLIDVQGPVYDLCFRHGTLGVTMDVETDLVGILKFLRSPKTRGLDHKGRQERSHFRQTIFGNV